MLECALTILKSWSVVDEWRSRMEFMKVMIPSSATPIASSMVCVGGSVMRVTCWCVCRKKRKC